MRTGAYQRRFEREEAAVAAAAARVVGKSPGRLPAGTATVAPAAKKDPWGLSQVEEESISRRRRVDAADLQLAVGLGPGSLLGEAHEVVTRLLAGQFLDERQGAGAKLPERLKGRAGDDGETEGARRLAHEEALRVPVAAADTLRWDDDGDEQGEGDDGGWEGGGWRDQQVLVGILDACLAS